MGTDDGWYAYDCVSYGGPNPFTYERIEVRHPTWHGTRIINPNQLLPEDPDRGLLWRPVE